MTHHDKPQFKHFPGDLIIDMPPTLAVAPIKPLRSAAPRKRIRPTLGIIGGGQLARMTAQSALSLGCDVVMLDDEADSPASAAAARWIRKPADDLAALCELAEAVDVVTLENEFIDARLLASIEERGHLVLPSAATMRLVQDKLAQKTLLQNTGLPVPAFAAVESKADLLSAGEKLGWPLVLKKRRDGYDGKGNTTVRGAADVDAAWARLDGDRHALFAEEFCPFTCEIAIIITSSRDGGSIAYPLVETVQRDHICHTVIAPAHVSEIVARQAGEIARRAVEAVGGIGSFGVEMFLCPDGAVLVNELAPRVHNSGHYTIEACECSQFENHVRAVMGWPLGSPAMRAPAAVMVNLLGHADGPGAPHGIKECLAIAGAHLHIYGKARSKAGRKMGHITALGSNAAAALDIATRAAAPLHFGHLS
jgi:5-(carboxyamino)imidazole ribonucleotide synthase